ncbi:hypothetical protein [Streptomyces thioluteus]
MFAVLSTTVCCEVAATRPSAAGRKVQYPVCTVISAGRVTCL